MIPFLRPLLSRNRESAPYELVDSEAGSLIANVVEPAFDSKSRRRGLLGRATLPERHALIIAPCNAVHTVGMKFPIDVLFVNRHGHVVKIVESLGAWRIAGALRASVTVELAAGMVRRTRVSVGDRLTIQRATTPVLSVTP
jgi:uncharacterized membrane protein (UPF0127 family)